MEVSNFLIETGMALWTSMFGLLAICLSSGHVNAVIIPGQCIMVNDLDLGKSAPFPIKFTEVQCAGYCMGLTTQCHAYHYSTDGLCYPLTEGISWSEVRATKPLKVCVLRINKKCDPDRFPLTYGRSRYAFIKEKMTWGSAATHCEAMGAKLLQLGSLEEQEFFGEKKDVKGHFIGLMKMYTFKHAKNEGWFWHGSGDPLDSSIKWFSGQPNNAGNFQLAGQMWDKALMDDTPPTSVIPFVCECFVV